MPNRDDSAPAEVILGLGANLGNPIEQLREATRHLEVALALQRVSSIYLTEPVGGADQPDYLNLACRGRTSLDPRALLAFTRGVEARLGRNRRLPNEPRTMDIDVLAYGGLVLQTAELTLPHPRMHERGFVLVPLEEIAPEWRHPVLGLTPREMIERAGTLERVERWGRLEDE